jgi:hypothetical protein
LRKPQRPRNGGEARRENPALLLDGRLETDFDAGLHAIETTELGIDIVGKSSGGREIDDESMGLMNGLRLRLCGHKKKKKKKKKK